MESPISVSWHAAPIRKQIVELTMQQRVAVLVDRRIDAARPLDLVASSVSFDQLLVRICEANGLGFCRVEDTYYLGPQSSAEFLFLDIAKGPSALRVTKRNPSLLGKRPLIFPDLAQPRDVLGQLAAEGGFEVSNPQRLPHDQMAGVNTPPCSVLQRLGMLLIQFDCWYEFSSDGRRMKLIDLPDERRGQVRTRWPQFTMSPDDVVALEEAFEDCRVRRSGKAIAINGPALCVMKARDWMIERKVIQQGGRDWSSQRFTLAVNNRRSAILRAIARQLKLEVVVETQRPERLNEVLSLKVEQASLEELLAELFAGSELKCDLAGETFVVRDGGE